MSVLAEYLGRLLADLDRPGELPDDLELVEPSEPHWVVGTLGVSYDDALDRIVLVAEELVPEDEEGDVARFTITREQAAAFAIRATLAGGSRPARRARCAGCPSTRPDTSARGRTATGHRHVKPPRRGRDRDRRPDAVELEPDLPRHLHARATRRRARCTSPNGANATCGTSPRRSTGARSPPTSCRALLGWDLVPETIARDDAPFGEGSLQRFVDADFSQHHFTLIEDERHHDQLRAICAFDVVANNADRKSGHCILGEDGTDLGHRQRPVLPPRAQAAHRHLGVRRRATARRACETTWPG